jgi:integrase
MPRKSTGSCRLRDGVYESRITIQGQERRIMRMPTCKTEAEASERSLLLSEQARRLRKAGHMGSKAADVLLDELAKARAGAVADVLQVIGELCGGAGVIEAPKSASPTFKSVAEAWLDGELSKRFPGRVDYPTEAWRTTVGQRLERAVYPVIGDLAIREVTREHCDEVLRRVPTPKGKGSVDASTLRQYGGILTRILNLAELASYIERNPLPRGWLPRPSAQKRFPILLPAEDSKLLATKTIPIVWRLFYGFLHREGVRREEAAELRWSAVDLENGIVTLDENKTDHPRWWHLDDGVADALYLWRKSLGYEPDPNDRVFSDQGCGLPLDHMAERVRGDLMRAKLARADLLTSKGLKKPFGTHCFRRSFVTRSLANGKNEDWVRRRTGHKSSELLRYRQEAKELAQAGVHELDSLAVAIPELNDSDFESDQNLSEGGGIGRRASLRCQRRQANRPQGGEIIDSESPETPHREASKSESDPKNLTPVDAVEAALSEALREATRAGQWAVVGQVAKELEARRLARSAVVDLAAERSKRGAS